MDKKLLILPLMILSFYANSSYVYKFDNKIFENVHIVDENGNRTDLDDENGFSPSGIHKDTGTLYNPEGYDKGGFDTNGLGNEECFYDANNQRVHSQTSLSSWGYVFYEDLVTETFREMRYPTGYYTFQYENHLYFKGSLMSTAIFPTTTARNYELCRKEIKQ